MSKTMLLLFTLLSCISFAGWLSYCTDEPWGYYEPDSTYPYVGVRFTPPTNAGMIYIVSVYCSAAGGSLVNPSFNLRLFHVSDGTPTSQICYKTVSFTSPVPAWRDFAFDWRWEGGSETEFLMAVEPLRVGSYPQYWDSRVWDDITMNPPNRNWEYYYWTGWELMSYSGDLMIRIKFCEIGSTKSIGKLKCLFMGSK